MIGIIGRMFSFLTYLWHVTNCWARYLTTGIVRLIAKYSHVALLRLDAADHAPKHGGLAAPARPQEAVDGPLRHSDIYIV